MHNASFKIRLVLFNIALAFYRKLIVVGQVVKICAAAQELYHSGTEKSSITAASYNCIERLHDSVLEVAVTLGKEFLMTV